MSEWPGPDQNLEYISVPKRLGAKGVEGLEVPKNTSTLHCQIHFVNTSNIVSKIFTKKTEEEGRE